MAVNTIATATLFQKNLDKAAAQAALTGWMESNASQVIYKGGAEVKIPKLDMDGLGNYDRNNGVVSGGITFEYERRKVAYDGGRSFSFDELYVDETNFVVTASTVMGEFQRTKVVPEIDAIRISKLSQIAMGVTGDTQAEYDYTPAKTTIVDKIKAGIQQLRKEKEYISQIIDYKRRSNLTMEYALLINQLEFIMQTKIYEVRGMYNTCGQFDRIYDSTKENFYTIPCLRGILEKTKKLY